MCCDMLIAIKVLSWTGWGFTEETWVSGGDEKGGAEMNTYQIIDEKIGRGTCTVWFSGKTWCLLSV